MGGERGESTYFFSFLSFRIFKYIIITRLNVASIFFKVHVRRRKNPLFFLLFFFLDG